MFISLGVFPLEIRGVSRIGRFYITPSFRRKLIGGRTEGELEAFIAAGLVTERDFAPVFGAVFQASRQRGGRRGACRGNQAALSLVGLYRMCP